MEVLDKNEFLQLLDFLYLKAVSCEYSLGLSIVSCEIEKLKNSLDDSYYYRFPLAKTIRLVVSLLEENGFSYEGLRNVFRSKDVAMILNIAEANIPYVFGMQMEKLYYDDDYVVGIHGSLHHGYEIEKSRFSTGLLCIHGPRINRTVRTKEDGLDFYSFLSYKYYDDLDVNAIIVRIPKENVSLPMWVEGKYGAYLNPGYIYGYYKSFYSDGRNRNPRIIKNPNYGCNYFCDICDEWLPSVVECKKKV